MGQQAARILVDTAGHAGPIITGSPNVLIGGFPSVRQGDGFTCTSHGLGSVTEGEPTVLINGKPAARMGDKTCCVGSPDLPTLAPIKGGGTLKSFNGGNLGVAGYNITDSNNNGTYDSIEGSASALQLNSSNKSKALGFDVNENSETNILNISGKAQSTYTNGVYNGNINGEGSIVSGNSEKNISTSWGNYSEKNNYDILYGSAGAYAKYDGLGSEIGGNYKVGGYSDTKNTNINIGGGAVDVNRTTTNDFLYSQGSAYAGGRGIGIENKTGVYSYTSNTEGNVLGVGVKENTSVDVLYVDGKAILHTGQNGVAGYNVLGKVAVASGQTEIGIGNEDSFSGYGALVAEGDVLYAQGGAKNELYLLDDENKRIGFQVEGGGKAGEASGAIGGRFSNMFIDGKVTAGGDVGAVGAYGKGGLYYDTDDYLLHANIGGDLALALGIKFDAELTLKFKPFVDAYNYFFGDDEPTTPAPVIKPVIIPGVIISGCSTVLIGKNTAPPVEKETEYTGSGWGHDQRQWLADKLGIDNDINNLFDAGVLSMLQFDEANLTGDALEKVKNDPAMIARENELAEKVKNDPRYGKEPFTLEDSKGVGFGGNRAPYDMWEQAKDPFNPKHRDTWDVAGNELTWLVRNTNVASTVNVSADGSMTMNHSFTDVFDLRPSEGRTGAYNTVTEITGIGYHDILGGNDELKINAEWTSKK